jgi:hypothetical protein
LPHRKTIHRFDLGAIFRRISTRLPLNHGLRNFVLIQSRGGDKRKIQQRIARLSPSPTRCKTQQATNPPLHAQIQTKSVFYDSKTKWRICQTTGTR